MLDTYPIRTEDMPSDMQILLDRYPRDSWDAQPGVKDKTRQWLNAHQSFRRLARHVREETEAYLDHDREASAYAVGLSRYGGLLVGNLHGHHAWEDRHYFPELSAADPRFDRGLDVLEKDHADLDRVLDQFTRTGNRALKLIQMDETQARDEVAELHKTADVIEAFLDRHLTDEEELAVPIILHHRLRG